MENPKPDIKIKNYNYSEDCRNFEKKHGRGAIYVTEDKNEKE
jgi:hypothetical protein